MDVTPLPAPKLGTLARLAPEPMKVVLNLSLIHI